MIKFLAALFVMISCYSSSWAAPASLTYQGRILKADGTPLEYNNVSFLFQITDPNGSCIVYEEQVNGYSMANSGGVFDTAIGLGTRTFPTTAGFSVLDGLNNSVALACKGGTTYTPTVSDGRLLRVEFFDGDGWKLITPDNVIRSVPYAGYAASATRLGTNLPTDFILKTGIPTCVAGSFLSWDGTALNCAAVAGASGGTVMSVSSANAYLSVSNGSVAAVLTVNVGTSANTVAAGNDVRFTDSRAPNGAAGGDLSGTYPNPSVAKLLGRDLDTTAPTSGQFLKFNGSSQWSPATIAIADVTGLSTSLSGMVMQSQFPASCAASQTLTFLSPSGSFTCSSIVVSGANFASQSAALVLASPTGASGAPTFRALASTDLPTSITDGLWSATSGNVYRNTGNVGIGTSAPTRRLQINETGSSAFDTTWDPGGAYGLGILASDAEVRLVSDAGGTIGSQFSLVEMNSNTLADAWGFLRQTTNGTGDGSFRITYGTSANIGSNATKFMIQKSGNVGIGTTAAGSSLSVYKAAATGTISTTGTAVTGTGTNFTTVFAVGDSLAAASQIKVITAIASATSMTIASAFTADLAASTAYSRLGATFNSGYVGIGTLTPASALDVFGVTRINAGGTGGAMVLGNPNGESGLLMSNTNRADIRFDNSSLKLLAVTGTSPAPVTNGVVITTAGFVGIGTATPSYKLDVTGTVNATAFYLNGSPFTAGSNSSAVAATGGSASSITQSATDAASAVRTALTLQNTGTGGANEYLIVGKNAAGTTTYSVNQAGDVTSNSLITPKIYGSTANNGTLTLDSTTSVTKGNVFIAPSGGYVGVGTTAPAAALHVSAAVSPVAFFDYPTTNRRISLDPGSLNIEAVTTGGAANSLYLNRYSSGTVLLGVGGGSVGIGTNAPTAALQVVGGVSAGRDTGYPVFAVTGAANVAGFLGFRSGTGGTVAAPTYPADADDLAYFGARNAIDNGSSAAVITMTAVGAHSATARGGNISFSTVPSGTTGASKRMIITDTGNVGIGSMAPTVALDILGNVNTYKVDNSTSGVNIDNQFQILTSPSTTGGNASTFGTNLLNQYASSNSSTGSIGGGRLYGRIASSSTGTVATIIGGMGQAENGSTLTIAGAHGLRAAALNSSTGTITNAYSGYFENSNTGGGTITNAYGTYIAALTGTNTWGVYQSSATNQNFFAGNVGIGTTTASAQLQIANSTMTQFPVQVLATTEAYALTASSRSAFSPSGTVVALATNTNSVVGGTLIDLTARNAAGSATGAFLGAVAGANINGSASFVIGRRTGTSTWAETVRVDESGNLGVGTATPGYKLDVNGSVNATGYYLNGSTFTPGNSSSAVAAAGGSAGTIAQTATNAATAARTALTLQNTGTGGANEYLLIGKNAAGTTTYSVNQAGDVTSNSLIAPLLSGSIAASANLTLDSTTSGTKGNVLIAPNGGNVGIGTATPTKLLTLSGAGAVLALTDTSTSLSSSLTGNNLVFYRAAGSSYISQQGIGGNLIFQTSIATASDNNAVMISNTGNLGIATMTPKALLDVTKTAPTGTITSSGTAVTGSSTNFTATFAVGDQIVAAGQGKTITAIASATAMTLNAAFTADLATATSYARVGTVLNAGNVGIGTTTPGYLLHISNSSGGATNITQASAGNIAVVGAISTGGTTSQVGAGASGGWVGTTSGNDFFLMTGNTDRMHITSAGNIGIGTASPGANLDISSGGYGLMIGADSAALTRTHATAKVGRIAFPQYLNANVSYTGFYGYSDVSRNAVFIGGGTSAYNAATEIDFNTAANQTTTSGTTRMKIDSAGNVGIGATSPQALLHVYQTAAGMVERVETTSVGNSYLQFKNGTSNVNLGIGGTFLHPYIFSGTGNFFIGSELSPTLYVNGMTNGSVGIGTTTPAAPLHVYTANTSGNIASFLSASGGCSIAYNGTSCSSDARLKENVETSDATAMLNNLLQVRSVHFTWIKDPNHEKQTGFIAQELQKLFPEFIKTDSNGLLQVNYASFVSVLTASIQELNLKFTKQFQSTQRDIASVSAQVELVKASKDKENQELKARIQQQDQRLQQQEKRLQQQDLELQAIKKKLNL